MQPTHILFQSENSEKVLSTDLNAMDKETQVVCVLSHDVKPVKVIVEGGRINFYFLKSETDGILAALLSNAEIPVKDFRLIVQALDTWRNAVATMKIKRNSQ